MNTIDGTNYESPTAWAAEGARVGLATCETCGAAILLDPRDTFDHLKAHSAWHASFSEG